MANAKILVIAGGGSGASIDTRQEGGGGGAGGLIHDTAYSLSVQSYSITVGTGGAGAGPAYANGITGNDSVAFGYTAKGGGGGNASGGGADGGSGGGAGTNAAGGSPRPGGASIGTPTQGNAGGTGYENNYFGGGGGGAGSAGGNGTNGSAGAGGAGLSNSISGSAVTYCRGGDAGENSATIPANRGHGSHCRNINGYSYAGSDGVVIISAPQGMVTATGGTKITSGGNDIWTFNSSGTFNVTVIATLVGQMNIL